MTLVAFATYGDRAELITDSSTYARNVRTLSLNSVKHLPLPQHDAAVITQGDEVFGRAVKLAALAHADHALDFDELVSRAPQWLSELSASMLDPDAAPMTVVLIGWSEQDQEFAAYLFPTQRGYAPTRVRGAWVMPAPFSLRPSPLELRRDFGPDGQWKVPDENLDVWKRRPPLQPPSSLEAWRGLAQTVREQRALEVFGKVIVAGKVWHTRLERGSSTTQVIHTFDDDAEQALLLHRTQHPVGQMQACSCGSGQRYRDCCLAAYYAKGHPCDCGSGKAFDDCCRLRSEELPIHPNPHAQEARA